MGNGDERMAEAGTACSGGSSVATCWRRCKERRLPRARRWFRYGRILVAREWGSVESLASAATLMEVGKERLVVTECTVPLAQGSGEVLRQPEAEEEVRKGRAGGPQPELQAHDSEARPPHRSTKKMAKPACALMAREAENGIHDPMKGGREAASEDAMVSVARIAVRREEVWGMTNRRVPELVAALSI
uniref:Uncharacterized protein n=1 Tax=Oryza sativa subsp. japonica TaxID=39947 RepID=Q6ESN8_ORYSJ|nr:hypothetical protein [Oryza sativa Japonica Group]